MRNQVLYSTLLAAAVLFLVNGCQKPVQPDPTLTLSGTEISVPAEGGDFSVSYNVTNPREGGKVTVEEISVDWVTDVVVTDSEIAFSVAENETTEKRDITVYVSYPGIEPDAEFTIVQDAGEPAQITLTLKEVSQTYAVTDIIPLDKEMRYVCFATSQEYLDEYGLSTDEALYEDDRLFIENQMSYYGYTIEDLTYYGDVIGAKFTGFSPDSDNVIYAYGIDINTMEPLTEIVYLRFKTLPVEMTDADFTFGEPVVDGPEVTVSVTPAGYDGWWSAYALETSTLDSEVSLLDHCSSLWNEEMSLWKDFFGFTSEEILQMLCIQGPMDISFTDLEPNTAYTIVVFAVSDDCLINSEPVSLNVTTGSVEMSDNEISIDVTGITGSTADISFNPSNDDSYGFAVYASSDLAGMTDEEILGLASSDSYLNVTSGVQNVTYSRLEPETGYSIVAFGYQANQVTTGLFREDFTTIEGISGSVEFELQFNGYYDIAETAEAFTAAGYADDGAYIETLAADYDALMPAEAVTTPEVGTFYYTLLLDVPENRLDDPEGYLSFLIANGDSQESVFYTLEYDVPMFAVGVALNDFGEPGPVWMSNSFTLTRDGVSDPQGFIDFIYGAATEGTSVTPQSASPRFNTASPAIKRYEPSKKVIRETYNGGEAKYVRMSGIEAPIEGSADLQTSRMHKRLFKK